MTVYLVIRHSRSPLTPRPDSRVMAGFRKEAIAQLYADAATEAWGYEQDCPVFGVEPLTLGCSEEQLSNLADSFCKEHQDAAKLQQLREALD